MQASPAPSTEGLATDAVTTAPAPLITGPVEMLWLLALAVLLIMAIVFVLLLRARAAQRRRLREAEADFFKPAGEAAEITFDDPPLQGELAPPGRSAEPQPKKKPSAFAGLFKQDDRKAPAAAPAPADIDDPARENADDGFATVRIERGADAGRDAAAAINARLFDEIEAEREAQRRAAETERLLREAEARQRAAEAAAERDRERREQEARLRDIEEGRREAERRAERLRAEDAGRFEAPPRRASAFADPAALNPQVAADLAAQRLSAATGEDYARTLAELEEAMAVQREAIQSETRALLDAFSQRLSQRLDSIIAAIERGAASGGAPSAALADIARDIAIVRERLDRAASVDPAMMQQELMLLRQAITGPRDAASPAVQLADVIRNALPPGAYEMPASLSNSRRADCLVRLPKPAGPIAIDARFPVEAFAMLRTADARRLVEAESEFRRVAIRHVVDIAERLISPGETADSAILFLPSEAMYTELHHRFPDVVQDAWRARVWIVSPTTLMATLHTIQAALTAAEPRSGGAFLAGDDPRMAGEMTELRRRIAALEELLARTQGPAEPAAPPRPPAPPRNTFQLSAVGRSAPPPPRPTPAERLGDLGAESEPLADTPPARPLFPLR
ncbi:MAG: DNA recombination protein RmuC [Parvularculaceae bacterium]